MALSVNWWKERKPPKMDVDFISGPLRAFCHYQTLLKQDGVTDEQFRSVSMWYQAFTDLRRGVIRTAGQCSFFQRDTKAMLLAALAPGGVIAAQATKVISRIPIEGILRDMVRLGPKLRAKCDEYVTAMNRVIAFPWSSRSAEEEKQLTARIKAVSFAYTNWLQVQVTVAANIDVYYRTITLLRDEPLALPHAAAAYQQLRAAQQLFDRAADTEKFAPAKVKMAIDSRMAGD